MLHVLNGKLKHSLSLIVLFCFVLLSPFYALADKPAEPEIVIILHTNDLHFDFNHREQVQATVEQYRQVYDNVYLVDAGDMFTRHDAKWPIPDLQWYEKASQDIIDFMNQLEYDAAVLGNHEIDYKKTITRDSLKRANFPLISANLGITTDKFIQPEPYIQFTTRQGHLITLLGLSIGNKEGIERIGNRPTIRQYLYLKEQSHVFGLLSHIGFQRDKRLAQEFPQLDLIIGGHSHTHLNPAVIHNNVLIAQTGGHEHEVDPTRPQHLGVIKLTIFKGKLIDKNGKVITFSASTPL
ncbi:metallophosphoesterase [Thiomicrospira microaerophila]|uniref:metallophosphoesterase n=1 Tax=Thiomicrospira microaerophila TaxID=406020 RepID=UPI0005C82C0C|nr:metallophosphoesterase [Thiomicrospira microaerophila]